MKKTTAIFWSFLVILLSASFAHAFEEKNGYPMIRGLYLSMPRNEAIKVLRKIKSEEQKRFPGCVLIENDADKTRSLILDFQKIYSIIILAYDKSGHVKGILFDANFFTPKDDAVSDEDFAKQFSEFYEFEFEKLSPPRVGSGVKTLYEHHSYKNSNKYWDTNKLWLCSIAYLKTIRSSENRRNVVFMTTD